LYFVVILKEAEAEKKGEKENTAAEIAAAAAAKKQRRWRADGERAAPSFFPAFLYFVSSSVSGLCATPHNRHSGRCRCSCTWTRAFKKRKKRTR
jgi:hypothetical protein